MSESNIFENVYLGNAHDAEIFKGNTISVRGEDVSMEFHEKVPYSILKTMMTGSNEEVQELFNTIVDDIENSNKKEKTLVYCTAGVDRSPLVIVCWLIMRKGFDIDEAYDLVIKKRDIVYRHDDWIEILERKNVL